VTPIVHDGSPQLWIRKLSDDFVIFDWVICCAKEVTCCSASALLKLDQSRRALHAVLIADLVQHKGINCYFQVGLSVGRFPCGQIFDLSALHYYWIAYTIVEHVEA
jgi:hypothetical protein